MAATTSRFEKPNIAPFLKMDNPTRSRSVIFADEDYEIIDGPPELDATFSLHRGTPVYFKVKLPNGSTGVWKNCELILWYQCDGDAYIAIRKIDANGRRERYYEGWFSSRSRAGVLREVLLG